MSEQESVEVVCSAFDVARSCYYVHRLQRCLMSKQRRTFSAEFKREAAALVLDHGYSHIDACRSLGVVDSALRRWVNSNSLSREAPVQTP